MSSRISQPVSPTEVPKIPVKEALSELLGKPRRVGPAQAPYLKGIPQLSDKDALLARRFHHTQAEQAHLDRQVTQICKQIREARQAWELDHQDEILWD